MWWLWQSWMVKSSTTALSELVCMIGHTGMGSSFVTASLIRSLESLATVSLPLMLKLIHSFKPHKKPRQRAFTNTQKRWNTKLSEVQVVFENSIHVIKTYKILSGVFWHWWNGKGQINGNHILTICITLANQRITSTIPTQLNKMSFDVFIWCLFNIFCVLFFREAKKKCESWSFWLKDQVGCSKEWVGV